MRQLDPGFATLPVDEPVPDHKPFFQIRIIKLPGTNILLRQFRIIAERTGTGTPLNDLIALSAQPLFFGHMQSSTAGLIQKQQLISLNVSDINITDILVHHPLKITCFLIQQPVTLRPQLGHIADIRINSQRDPPALMLLVSYHGVDADPGMVTVFKRSAAACLHQLLAPGQTAVKGMPDAKKLVSVPGIICFDRRKQRLIFRLGKTGTFIKIIIAP